MRGKRKKIGEGLSLLFWNVAGLGRQDLDFWYFIKEFDYIGLGETWLEEKGWNKLKNRLPKTHY